MILMMCFQENFYLLREECEQFVCRFRFHQRPRHSDFGLLEGEGLVAVQDNTTDSEIRATEINGQVDALGVYC
jgi:hypothetical protein